MPHYRIGAINRWADDHALASGLVGAVLLGTLNTFLFSLPSGVLSAVGWLGVYELMARSRRRRTRS